jgi:uncharacterized protein (TIGR00251 family)
MKKESKNNHLLPFLRETKNGIEIHLHVQPGASKNEISGIHGSSLKLRIKAPPADGKANKECQIFLAKFLDVPTSDVILISGNSSREKKFLIKGTMRYQGAEANFTKATKE